MTYPIDNSGVNIRAGGQFFAVGKKSVCTSVSDLTTNESNSALNEKTKTENSENVFIKPKYDKKLNKNYDEAVFVVDNDFETFPPHSSFYQMESEKRIANEKLLNAIDRTLIKFGLHDNATVDTDLNMNENKTSEEVSNPTAEIFIPTIENIINKTCESRVTESRKRRLAPSRRENGITEDEITNFQSSDDATRDPLFINTEPFFASKSTNTNHYSLRKCKSAPNPFKNVRLQIHKGK